MPMSSLSFVLIGEESLLVACAETLGERGHQVAAIVADAPPLRRWAEQHGVRLLSPSEPWHAVMGPRSVDYLLSVANFRILSDMQRQVANLAAINFHDGPLPRYGGLYAPSWGILAGETEWGVTWHRIIEEVDAGAVLMQRSFVVAADANTAVLNSQCFAAGVQSFSDLLDRLERGDISGDAQPIDASTYHGARARPNLHGVLDPQRPVLDLVRTARALDFGSYPNPLCLPKLLGYHGSVAIRTAELAAVSDLGVCGRVVVERDDSLLLQAVDGVVRLTGLRLLSGEPISAPGAVALLLRTDQGELPTSADQAWQAFAREMDGRAERLIARESRWRRLMRSEPVAEIPGSTGSELGAPPVELEIAVGAEMPELAFAVTVVLARLSGQQVVAIGIAPANAREGDETLAQNLLLNDAPLVTELRLDETLASVRDRVIGEFARLAEGETCFRDLLARLSDGPSAGFLNPPVSICDRASATNPGRSAALELSRLPSGVWQLHSPDGRLAVEALRVLADGITAVLAADRATAWSVCSLMSATEEQRILGTWGTGDLVGDTAVRCVHEVFAERVKTTPHSPAVTGEDVTLTYAELAHQSDRVAARLRELGIGPDQFVGISCARTPDMVVAVLGVLKAGGAYVPMDPSYPIDRLEWMLEDSGARVVLVDDVGLLALPESRALRLHLDRLRDSEPDVRSVSSNQLRFDPSDLAYCIYTSGSTGKPKGVLVEHRNVDNFFRAMDARLGTEVGTWLAVTSLSFDISVLELLWTLTRGFHVVLLSEGERSGIMATSRESDRPIDFSLFYFSADEDEAQDEPYQLLLQGARFGDEHGFTAVWTPERHFHAFGGLYPNASVTGAAVAAVTSHIGIRAGSCVLPLHHPARVAEEWAVVDRLSNGRVGISFAAGWQPDDFIFRPENFSDVKSKTFSLIESVRRLWRGERLMFPGPRGDVEVMTRPRPVQPELPVWYTTAGNPESYAMAGRAGYNILTHLLGQSLEELAAKVAAYRRAWEEAGHKGRGTVSLMLHTFVGEDDAVVKEQVREPLKSYLRTSISLIQRDVSAFPIFKKNADGSAPALDFSALSPEEFDSMLDYSFERYYETSGLFGTIERSAAMVDRVKAIDIDEIACLIDFGVPSPLVLSHLRHLARLKSLTAIPRVKRPRPTVSELVQTHGVTHLQCTPSMLRMLMADEQDLQALRALRVLCVGGEAFPADLLVALDRVRPQRVFNMYGPTETTIWSTMAELPERTAGAPLGSPLRNTQLLVVDSHGEPLPPGVPGELWIGGDGVVRGYWRRPELTASRFISRSTRGRPVQRWYRTGDLVRWRHDGVLEFLGRLDHQVKVRGYRIELGEIESVLASHAAVREVVVVPREFAAGDVRLEAWIVPAREGAVSPAALRGVAHEHLPDFMVPAEFHLVDRMPLTPNGKVDRKALSLRPRPLPLSMEADDRPAAVVTTTGSELEAGILRAWLEVLQRDSIDLNSNFFDLGGHSLLAVKLHGRLRGDLGVDLAITDLFRFPTVRSLAEHLQHGEAATATPSTSQTAEARRAAVLRRRAR